MPEVKAQQNTTDTTVDSLGKKKKPNNSEISGPPANFSTQKNQEQAKKSPEKVADEQLGRLLLHYNALSENEPNINKTEQDKKILSVVKSLLAEVRDTVINRDNLNWTQKLKGALSKGNVSLNLHGTALGKMIREDEVIRNNDSSILQKFSLPEVSQQEAKSIQFRKQKQTELKNSQHQQQENEKRIAANNTQRHPIKETNHDLDDPRYKPVTRSSSAATKPKSVLPAAQQNNMPLQSIFRSNLERYAKGGWFTNRTHTALVKEVLHEEAHTTDESLYIALSAKLTKNGTALNFKGALASIIVAYQRDCVDKGEVSSHEASFMQKEDDKLLQQIGFQQDTSMHLPNCFTPARLKPGA